LLQVLVSPVLAGLAVGIGVPILLFYVYGVVPISLCRSGGCGVSTSGAGVCFDFDDESDLLGAFGARNTGNISFTYCTLKKVQSLQNDTIQLS
jgi:E3 ubiquitin-protein ligase RNF19A